MMLESSREAEALSAFLDTPRGQTLPKGGGLWILRAVEGSYLPRFSGESTVVIRQTDRRLASPFLERGLDPLASPTAPVHLAIVFGTKHREEVLFHLALVAERLEEGGSLVVTVANDLGAGSMEKRIRELLGNVEPFSKHKCRVLHAVKREDAMDLALLGQWKAQGELRELDSEGFWSCPGIFSWRRPDDGSRLLAGFIPSGLKGKGADFGAGYGYLARELLNRCPGIESLDLLEVEKKALDAAEKNLESYASGSVAIRYHWIDLTQGAGLSHLDFILMNPPFHAERGNLPSLGRQFIAEGLRSLRSGGRLYLVANRQLPYESVLSESGGVLIRRQEASGFKLLEVEKR
jgi:16S rRNA (guanine1207-N2)-methyltransferase